MRRRVVASGQRRRRSAPTVRRGGQHFRSLIEHGSDLIAILDGDGTVRYVSPSHTRVLGYQPEELVGRHAFDFVHPDDTPALLDAFQRGVVGEVVSASAEFRFRHKDGSWRTLEGIAKNAMDDPAVAGVIVNTRDITERKRAEEDLRQAQDRFRSYIERANDLIFTLDPSGRITAVNRAVCEATGYAVEELLGRAALEIIAPETLSFAAAALGRIWSGERIEQAEIEMLAKDGRRITLEVRGRALREGDRLLETFHIARDITERKRAQVEILYQANLIANVNDAIVASDGQIRVRAWNRAAEAMYGWTAAEVMGQPTEQFLQTEFVDTEGSEVARLLAESGRFRGEVTQRRKDGARFAAEVTVVVLRDPEGAITGYVTVSRDITERKRAEEERARLSAAVEQAGESVTITDAAGTIVYVNPATERLTGYSRAELIGQNARLLRSERQEVEAHRRLVSAITRGEVWSGSEILQRKDGSPFELACTVSPIHDASRCVINYVGIGRDVTYERQVAAQLRQAQKLEAVGRLAGGVAHDFNNQLTIIKGCAQFLLSSLPPDDERHRDAQRIAETVDRGARLVRQLLTFSRLEPVETRAVNLTDLINEMAPMLRLLLGEQIVLRVHGAADLWPVRVDRSQIEQVLMNLVGNARDAIAPAGDATTGQTVTIEAANVELDRWVHRLAESVQPGPYVALVVGDDGPGMPAEVRDHVFEPFFTTKDFGKGTGLGLATVYGIVKQHGGCIACSSQLGHGTTFEIYFPRDDSGAAIHAGESARAARRAQARARHARTVLVAEDEADVREVLMRALEESGYRVYGAAHSDDALAVAAQVNGGIDLLVTDVVLPGRSGHVLARRLRQVHPQLRVLFVSGYFADTLDLSELPGARFLQKPYGLDELLQAIEEMLGG